MTEETGFSPAENLVAQGAIVMKYENAEMRSFALAHRRNESEVKDRALAILEQDADAVACAYYSIPHKEHTRGPGCTRQADDDCPVKHVEGIGIDAARELARLWQNNATRVYFSHEDDDRIWLSGVFVDLETNTRVELPYGVSKLGVPKGGGTPYVLNPQRLGLAIQAGVSKAARNAITNGLPRSLSRAYFDRAKELLGSSSAIKIPQLLAAFEGYDVTREMLEGFYGAHLEELSAEQRKNLRGLFVAIREGLVDPKEYFAGSGGGGGGATEGTGRTPQSHGVTPPPSAPTGATAEVKGGTAAAPAEPASGGATGPATDGATDGATAPEPAPAAAPAPGAAPTPQTAPATAPPTGGATADSQATQSPIPAPAPESASQPTPQGVQSESPSDDTDEPGQPQLQGLGI